MLLRTVNRGLSAHQVLLDRFSTTKLHIYLELDPELLQQIGHPLGLLLHVLDVLHQPEDPQLALRELGPHLEGQTLAIRAEWSKALRLR